MHAASCSVNDWRRRRPSGSGVVSRASTAAAYRQSEARRPLVRDARARFSGPCTTTPPPLHRETRTTVVVCDRNGKKNEIKLFKIKNSLVLIRRAEPAFDGRRARRRESGWARAERRRSGRPRTENARRSATPYAATHPSNKCLPAGLSLVRGRLGFRFSRRAKAAAARPARPQSDPPPRPARGTRPSHLYRVGCKKKKNEPKRIKQKISKRIFNDEVGLSPNGFFWKKTNFKKKQCITNENGTRESFSRRAFSRRHHTTI